MSSLKADTIVNRHPQAAHRVLGGSAVIVIPRDAKMLTLNDVGTKIWTLIDTMSVQQIAETIAKDYDMSVEDALKDTMSFLKDLEERGLLAEQG